ncbi:hypothetical protein ACOBR2_06715 [Telmatobacter bradus]|uniref:hypothetical protein n=1 Tax=Telmatobacter bradus TaxID=474953 RepID=UPI003B43150A
MQTITIGSNTYELCTVPSSPGAAAVSIGMNDTVGVSTSPYNRAEQVFEWVGGDYWDATITLPPMSLATAASWRGFLAELHGRARVFQLYDPGALSVSSDAASPVVDSSVSTNNLALTNTLVTRGWPASAIVLVAGQQLQVGYRLYSVCEAASADSTGAATVTVWPSLRETPADGTVIVLAQPQGLFRLASNRREIQWSPSRLTTVSLKCVEAR